MGQPTELRVSKYDQVSGILVAALILFGFVVGLMLLIWMSGIRWKTTTALPVRMAPKEDVGGSSRGDGKGIRPIEQEFEAPATDEIPAPTEPTKVEDMLEAISLAAAAVEPVIEEVTSVEASSLKGKRKGKGRGDGDGDGPGTEIGIPAWERWEVQLSAGSPEEYAKQLDFFQIELAVAGGGSPVVTYLSHVSAKAPTKRTGNPMDEKRLRFMHRSGVLREADKSIFAKNGIETNGRVMFQFYSLETYTQLLALENSAMRPRKISEVRRTIFGVKEVGGGYEFFVISQEYR